MRRRPFIQGSVNNRDELSLATAYNDRTLDAFNDGIVGHDEYPFLQVVISDDTL